MRHLLLFFCFFTIGKTYAQIDILETKEKEYPKPPKYDSSYNSGAMKKLLGLTGQTIYFIPQSKKFKETKEKYSSDFLTKKSTSVKNPQRPTLVANPNLSKEMNNAIEKQMDDRFPNVSVYTYCPVKVKYNFLTTLDSIVGKYFCIRGVIENPKLEDRLNHRGTYLELAPKKNIGDSLLFRISQLDSKAPDYTFSDGIYTFLIQGYHEKLKKQYVNKKFILTKEIKNIWDINTGKIINIDTLNKEWVCKSLTLIETQSKEYLQLCLILTNGDKTIAAQNISGGLFASDAWETISLTNFKTEEQVLFEKMLAEEIEKQRKEAILKAEEVSKREALEKKKFELEMINKYGARIGKLISENKVVIGMSKNICTLSWGDPYDIIRTITKGRVFEQWVYSMGTYLYFENDVLVAIQD